MTAPAWASPYTADPAAYGLTPVEIVQYDGRRFRVIPPGRCGGMWEWQEVGASEVYSASSMRMAFLWIGALCAIERKGGTLCVSR